MPNYGLPRNRNKPHNIDVCKEGKSYGVPGKVITVIKRVLVAESMGNFNPVFCTYKGKRYLVHSRMGDLSDPFRATKEYLNTLYFEVPKDECK